MPPEKFNCTACGFSGSKRAVSTHISQRQDENHGGSRGHFEGYKDLMERVGNGTEEPEEGTEDNPDNEGTTVTTEGGKSQEGEKEPEENPEPEGGDSGNGVLSLLEKYGILEL